MHNNKDFNLYTRVVNYDEYLRINVATCIPNVQRDLRIHLLDESYNLLRSLYEAEYTKGNIRMKNITEMLVIISMLDFISAELLEYCPNKIRKIIKSIEMLTEIKNMTYSWRKNPEPDAKENN